MCQTALNLRDHVLPPAVPLRQWVLTLPFELRGLLAYDAKALGAVSRIFVDSVLGFYSRRLRATAPRGQGGAVTVVQRASSDLRLNPHLHAVFLDGIFTDGEGKPAFHELPRLRTDDVADLLQVARVRILRHLARRGFVVVDADALEVKDELAERDPPLAELAAAAVSGLPPAGPASRRRPVRLAARRHDGPEIRGPLVVADRGFNLHARTCAGALDDAGRLALLKYVLRPPVANDRLTFTADRKVRIALKRDFSDGTYAIDLDPLALLFRLAATVPAPRFHTVRYAGVLASAASLRPKIIPPPLPPQIAAPAVAPAPPPQPPPTGSRRSGFRKWAELLRLTFAVDVEACPGCGGRMKLVALVRDPDGVRRFLGHLGLPTEPPPLGAARGPPFERPPERRHKPSPSPAAQMFDEP